MKNKYGMSVFWKDVIWLSFFILLSLFPFVYKPFISLFEFEFGLWLIRGILILLTLTKIGLIHEAIAENLGVKFKIIRRESGWSPYEVKVFRPVFCLFVWGWKPLAKGYHSYETQNIFGAKMYEGYSIEVTYKTESDSRDAIEKYKRNSRKDLKEYMSRTEKEVKTIIKV